MKTFCLILALALPAFFHGSAQVTVSLAMHQQEFLPGESIPVAVKITNRSGRQLYFGKAANWLTFSVESVDGFVVIKKSNVPVQGVFHLESSQMGTKNVDIAPYFVMTKPGRYRITATLRIQDWPEDMTSAPASFSIVPGVELWSQDFGVPATNGVPVMRKYTLEQANYLNSQMRLYVQLSDTAEAIIYRTTALGPMVSFSQPQAQVDRWSRLHVLWQAGARSFNYSVVNPNGEVADTDIYDDFNTRPRLKVNEKGDVLVAGGVRRPKPGELPDVKPPVQVAPGQ